MGTGDRLVGLRGR